MAVAKEKDSTAQAVTTTQTVTAKGSDKINKLSSAEVDKYFNSAEGQKELAEEERASRAKK